MASKWRKNVTNWAFLALTGAWFGCSAEPPAAENPGNTWDQKREQLEYPRGPYGTKAGAIIDNLSFMGWKNPAAAESGTPELELLRLSDFYNPDGRSATKLIFFNASAVWCSVCQSEFRHFNTEQIYAKYQARGLQFLSVLFQDKDYFPARLSDLKNWTSLPAHHVTFPMGLDPGFKSAAFFPEDATPLNVLIDARTMRIVHVMTGYRQSYWDYVDQVLSTQ